MSSSPVVLVTGGTGFVGAYTIIDALNNGYTVRTTVRSLKKSEPLKESLLKTSPKLTKEILDTRLSFYEADLTKDAGWEEAVKGSKYIIHVASPFILGEPKHEDDLIIPAREGALRVLKAAHKLGGVEKIVLTSSFAAIAYGHPNHTKLDESWWTKVENVSGAYIKSKTLAEKAAWDYVKANNVEFKFTVINPVGITGPAVAGAPSDSPSLDLIKILVSGELKFGAPKLYLGVIDVRDVAEIQVAALTNAKSDGERFLLVSGKEFSMLELGGKLRKILPKGDPKLKKLPTGTLPSWLVKFLGLFVESISGVAPYLDKQTTYDSSKAQKTFNWTPISSDDSVKATYDSLVADKKI